MNNTELARMFFDVMTRTSMNGMMIQDQRRIIESYKDDIATAFEKRGILTGLKMPRFPVKYYTVLESILRYGVEKTAEQQVHADVARQRRRQFRGIPGRTSAHVKPEESLPSWDDGIKHLES